MTKDINNVADDISLAVSEVIEATEATMKLEIAQSLNEGSNSNDVSSWSRTQSLNKNNLQKSLVKRAKNAIVILENITRNVGSYTGTEQEETSKKLTDGVNMLVSSALANKDKQVKSVLRLEKYKTSSQYVSDLKESIVNATQTSIAEALPIKYKDGRKISYKAYMEMAVRTGIQQEIGEKQLEIGGQNNVVFYIVNEFGDVADDHKEYQGRIYYDDRWETFPYRDDIKSQIKAYIKSNSMMSVQEVKGEPVFLTTRPNCRHRFQPISIDQALQGAYSVKQSMSNLVQGSYRDDNYELTKEQRLNERMIRKYKQQALMNEELYKTTGNKSFLDFAQKYKKMSVQWQSKQRKLISEHSDVLRRDYRREGANIILEDIGAKYNLGQSTKIVPITNVPTTPATPAQTIAVNQTVQKHYEMPKEEQKYINKKITNYYKGENIISKISKGVKADITNKDFTSNIKKNMELTSYNEKPSVLKLDDFRTIANKTNIMFFRTYAGKEAEKYRKDMEEGDFFVDNKGGAVYGRGMYFYYVKTNEVDKMIDTNAIEKQKALSHITDYAFESIYSQDKNAQENMKKDEKYLVDNVRLDTMTLKFEARITDIISIRNEYAKEYAEKNKKEIGEEPTNIFLQQQNIIVMKDRIYDQIDELVKRRKRDASFTILQYDIQRKILDDTLSDFTKKEKELYDKLKKMQIENIDLYNNYRMLSDTVQKVDDGVKAVQLGYDGYTLPNGYPSYFVLVNRSAVVLLDNEGKSDDENFNIKDIMKEMI